MLNQQIEIFKGKVLEKINDKIIDHSKPYKKSKRLEILVIERENDKADVKLFYTMRYSRMFGQHDSVIHNVMENVDMKEACIAARKLKETLPAFRIVFCELEELF